MIHPTFPAEFPGAWQNLPPAVRDFLAARLVEKALEIHDGPEGLIKFLYAGQKRPGAAKPLSYIARGREFWPHVVEDTKVWLLKLQVPLRQNGTPIDHLEARASAMDPIDPDGMVAIKRDALRELLNAHDNLSRSTSPQPGVTQ